MTKVLIIDLDNLLPRLNRFQGRLAMEVVYLVLRMIVRVQPTHVAIVFSPQNDPEHRVIRDSLKRIRLKCLNLPLEKLLHMKGELTLVTSDEHLVGVVPANVVVIEADERVSYYEQSMFRKGTFSPRLPMLKHFDFQATVEFFVELGFIPSDWVSGFAYLLWKIDRILQERAKVIQLDPLRPQNLFIPPKSSVRLALKVIAKQIVGFEVQTLTHIYRCDSPSEEVLRQLCRNLEGTPIRAEEIKNILVYLTPYLQGELNMIEDRSVARWLLKGANEELGDLVESRAKLRSTSPRLLEIYDTVELPIQAVIAKMEAAGFPYDEEALHERRATLEQSKYELQTQVSEKAGFAISLASSQDLYRYLIGKLGLSKEIGARRSRAKQTGFANEILARMALKKPEVQLILDYRHLAMLSQSIFNLTRHFQGGRFYPTYSPTGTVSGRIVTSQPNLQGIPRELRPFFRAPKGYVLVSGDYSQIELRVLAYLSGDPSLNAALNSGEDLHKAMAAHLFGGPTEMISHAERNMAKTVNYGILYGMGPKALAKELGVKIKDAKELIVEYQRSYPMVMEYFRCVEHAALNHHRIENAFGHIRLFPSRANYNQVKREARNYPIQSTASGLLKRAMLNADCALDGLDARMVLQLHDEIIVEAREDVAEEAQRRLQVAMLNATAGLPMNIVVNSGMGQSWGDLKNH